MLHHQSHDCLSEGLREASASILGIQGGALKNRRGQFSETRGGGEGWEEGCARFNMLFAEAVSAGRRRGIPISSRRSIQ